MEALGFFLFLAYLFIGDLAHILEAIRGERGGSKGPFGQNVNDGPAVADPSFSLF